MNRRAVSILETLEPRLVFAAFTAGDLVLPVDTDASTPVANLSTLADEWSASAWANDTSALRDRFALYGHGQTVAIIDSGIAYDHYALGGGLGSDYRVVGGWDFAENDADPYDDGPLGFHGTHVAGIVGSNDDNYTGVASGVDLVALRVFDDQGNGESQWIADALSWVHDHRFDFEHPITTVNLSVGVGDLDSATAASIENALQTLEQDGLFISVSAGNDFDGTTNLKNPASSQYVVPVASVGDDGLLSDFSQRNGRILAAPGEMITSTAPDYVYSFDGVTDDFLAASGTSMSAPHVAAASVLLREVYQNLGQPEKTQDELYHHFLQTADTVADAETQRNYQRVNLSAAIEAALGADETGDSRLDASHLGTISHRFDFDGVINELADADAFTFVAGLSGTLKLDSDWTAAADGPSIAIDNEELASNEFRVQAGHEYTLTLADAQSVGRYDVSLELTPTVDVPKAAAPSSAVNETSYHWSPEEAGWYEFQISLVQASDADHVRIYAGEDELVYASSQMFTDHTAQLYVERGATVRIALSGGKPSATFAVSQLDITGGDGGPGGAQSLDAGQSSNMAAVVFSDPDQVHQLAWASKREIAMESVDASLAADSAIDEAIDEAIDGPWLSAIAASSTVRNHIALDQLHPDGSDDDEKDEHRSRFALADELFALPKVDTSNLLRD